MQFCCAFGGVSPDFYAVVRFGLDASRSVWAALPSSCMPASVAEPTPAPHVCSAPLHHTPAPHPCPTALYNTPVPPPCPTSLSSTPAPFSFSENGAAIPGTAVAAAPDRNGRERWRQLCAFPAAWRRHLGLWSVGDRRGGGGHGCGAHLPGTRPSANLRAGVGRARRRARSYRQLGAVSSSPPRPRPPSHANRRWWSLRPTRVPPPPPPSLVPPPPPPPWRGEAAAGVLAWRCQTVTSAGPCGFRRWPAAVPPHVSQWGGGGAHSHDQRQWGGGIPVAHGIGRRRWGPACSRRLCCWGEGGGVSLLLWRGQPSPQPRALSLSLWPLMPPSAPKTTISPSPVPLRRRHAGSRRRPLSPHGLSTRRRRRWPLASWWR